MDLRHLRYFVAVAEELSFVRAAGRLHMAQPPLSRQIRNLEDELGVKLFDRAHRRVRLTDAGKTLLERAGSVFGTVNRAVEDTQRTSRGQGGRVSLGYVPIADCVILPRILNRFRVSQPQVQIDPQPMTTPEQIAALKAGEIDVGLVRLPGGAKDLHVSLITREPLVLAAPSAHPLSKLSEIPLSALKGVPCVRFRRESEPVLYDVIQGFLKQFRIECLVAAESAGSIDTLSLVSAGVGVALLPACIKVLRRAGVVYRPIRPRPFVIETGLAYRRGHPSETRAALLQTIHSLYPRSEIKKSV